MGRSRKPKIVQKLLDDSTLSVNTLIEELKATNVTITWPLKNYSKLKKDANVKIDVSSRKDKWMFIICKTESQLRVILFLDVCSEVNSVDFGIRNSDGEMFDTFACVYENKTLLALIENKAILDPQNKLLNDDILILEWAYTARPNESNIVLMPQWQSTHYDQMQNYHADSLCNDLKDLFLEARFTDFLLVFNGKFFMVHKFILCARSTYFERMTKDFPNYNYDEINIDIGSDIMYHVLLYMYSGYLPDMHVFDMTEIFDLACFLEIKSLIKMCKVFFKTNLSIETLRSIAFVITKYEETEIGEAIKKFLDSQPESVLQSDEWRDVFEDATDMLKWMDRNTNNLITIKTVETV